MAFDESLDNSRALEQQGAGQVPALLEQLQIVVETGRLHGDAHTRSVKLGEFLKDFIVVQRRLGKAKKSTKNTHLGNWYASLDDVMDVVNEGIGELPFAIFQTARTDYELQAVFVETTVLHGSEQWVSQTLSCKPPNLTAQAVGAAATYLRRYGLCLIFGITAETDDDGNSGRGGSSQGQGQKNRTTTTAGGKTATSTADDKTVTNTAGGGNSGKPPFQCSQDRQAKLLQMNERAAKVGKKPDDLVAVVCEKLTISGTPNLRNFKDGTMDKALRAMDEYLTELEETLAVREEQNATSFVKEPVPATAKAVKR